VSVFSQNDWMACRFVKLRRKPHGGEFVDEPVGASADVASVLRVCGDARETEKSKQVFEL